MNKDNSKNKKFVRVMFGNTSGANGFVFKENEINTTDNWHPEETDPGKIGGFNFLIEDKMLRYLVRGDTICDVAIPDDAEVIDLPNDNCPHGIFLANKIIVSNIRPVTDLMAMEFYKKSSLPGESYYKSLAGCAMRGYKNTAMQIIKDKVNKDNIDLVLGEVDDFYRPGHYWDKKGDKKVMDEIYSYLKKIKDGN